MNRPLDAGITTGELTASIGTFTVDRAGPPDGDLVLLLHGFPQSRHSWRAQLPALAAAGYSAVAPDQRGYSPGARPDPSDLTAYGIDRLVDDAGELVDRLGADRFHLVGHDWGGQVAWRFAAAAPDRLASLTVLSRPHPSAFARAVRDDVDEQRHRSRHHKAFHNAGIVELLLADDAHALRSRLVEEGVSTAAADEYLSVLGEPAALEAALAWYRAVGTLASTEAGPIDVPTLYIWGADDSTVGPSAAGWTQAHVRAPYVFVALPGVGHFVTDQAPDVATSFLLEHLRRFPV